jgi:hypothetical protein
MANWIVQNCLDPSDIRVAIDSKNQLSAGVIFPAGEMVGTIGCFQAQSETLDLGTLRPTSTNSIDCVNCLANTGFNFIFRDCRTLSDYHISPYNFSGVELPTVGTIYEANIGGEISFLGCFEFIGVTSELNFQSSISIIKEFPACSECQKEPKDFTTYKDEIVNNVNYQEFKQNLKDNYSELLENRLNPNSQEQSK